MSFRPLPPVLRAPGATQVGPGVWLHPAPSDAISWHITRTHLCAQTDMRVTTHRLATRRDHALAILMQWWELASFAIGTDTIELKDVHHQRWTLARYCATSGHWHIVAVCEDTAHTLGLKPDSPDYIKALQHHGLDTRPIEIALAELEHWLVGDAVNDSPPQRAA